MSFNFGSRFQYIAAPPVGDGPGGEPEPTSTPITHSTINSIPGHAYIDIFDAGTSNQTYSVTINDTSFYGFKYYTYKNHETVYNPPHLLNTAGGTTTGWTWKRTSSTTNNTTVTVTRGYSAAGRCSDTVEWWNSSSNVYSTTSYPYLILAKAVAVAAFGVPDPPDPTAYAILAPNAVRNVTVNSVFYLDKSLSRGADVSCTWTVLKTDPAGTFTSVAAIPGTDYSLEDGTTLASDEAHIKLLQAYNFEFKLTAVGYTFNSNPFQNYPSITQANTSIATYFFNTTVGTYNYEIKVPKIDFTLDVPAAVLLGTDPFETYQGQLITVTPVLDLSTGYWKRLNASGPASPTVLTKTDAEWRTEITAKCDVILEARKKDTGELETTRVGLDPFTISLQYAIHYNLQFKTTLK